MINADDMQSWAYLLAPTFQFVNTAGKPLTEGYIEVYIAGTRNKYYCASDFNGTLHPFQIPLDSLGANIVLADPDQAYDVYVYNKYGSLIMSRYHVSPGMAGGSGVLSITIGSEDGTVSVSNDGNGNFDLSIQDTVDRIDALEQAVSGLSADSSVGYAIAHAYTVELDGTFDLVSDAVTGIGYTPNMDGFRLKSGHVYQFNFNALFENGAFDRNCSGKLYLEGPNTIAQEWKFDLDDSYYHSQSINGSTVLVTPNDLNYYDVKLKLSWDVDYPNKPNVDLNKISIVDITTLLSTTVSGVGGNYTGGDGIFVNDESYVISVDMDYINSHLNIDATEIIASAVNIATAYTDARVTTVSGDLVNLIAEVSASIPTGIEQVQSDWTEQDSSSPAYIQHKPDLTVYATNASLTAVSSVLQSEIDAISGAIPTDYVTHDEVSAVSGNIIEYVNSVSGDLVETINNVSGDIIHTVESVSGDIIETITTVSGDVIETINNVSGDIIETVNNVSGDIIHTVESVSGDLVEIIETATANIPEQVNADWEAVSGKSEILNKPDLSIYATHTEVSGVSAVLNERINNVSGDLIETITTVSGDIINTVESVSAVLEGDIVSAIQVATGAIPEQVNSDWNAVSGKAEILNKPDLSIYATHDELVDAVTAVSSMIPTDYVTHNEVSAVSANLVNYVNSVSGDITNYVDESIVSAINVATGSFEQVQSDWTEDDTNDPAYIQNKPNEIEIVAGQNIGIFSDATTITIAASATDLSNYATHSEVNTVSGILESEIQAVSAAIGEQVPNVSIQSPSGTLVINETVSGNNKIYSIDVAPTSGIEYGQFYATNITGAATMARTKGNIDITNDGKIKLKKGQSYHVTVRGRYNQSVLKDNYGYASYIEYVTNNSININVDESRSGSQYFELSYDLFKLNSDTDYYVFFTLDDATVNDLFIDIHSLANVGSNGSSGGSSPEYDAGYGIQILNNVISVSGISPQVQSDWNQTNSSSVDYIKNKPEEYGLLAGDNISITASGNNFVISSTASAASGTNYQAGYGIDITGDTISIDASIIPEQQVNSDWTATSGVAEILNKPNESELIAGAGVSITASGSNYIISAVVTGSPVISGYVTETELQTVSGNIVNQIPDVSNLATKTEVQTVSAAIPTLPSEEEVEFEEVDLSDYALASSIPDVSNLATKTELATVSASIPDISGLATNADLQIVSAAIPDVSGFATVELVSAVSGKLPTTEIGKFTIHSNVSGGPIEVLVPTDQAPDSVFYQINSVSGYAYASNTSNAVINYYYGETPADFNGSDDSILFTINDNISNIGAIYFYYTTAVDGMGGPNLTTTNINGNSSGIVQTGTYKLKAYYNQAGTSSPYGKYLQIMFNWRNYASDAAQSLQWAQEALSKITFFGVVRPDPTLGTTVNLDRYYLSNTESTSHATECVVVTDSVNKKQKVFLPNSKPSSNSWKDVQFIAYGSGSVTSSVGNEYIAYKQVSGTSNLTFAFLADSNSTNRIYTFITFEPVNGKFEKWIYDGNTGVTNRWTTEIISYATEAELQAVSGALDDYIPYSASGVVLPNSKFEIDTAGQAYKIVTDASEIDYTRFDTGIYFRGDGSSSVGTYKATLPSNVHHIYIDTSGGAIVTGTYDIATHSAILNVSLLPSNSECYVFAYDRNSNLIELSGSNTSVKYITPAVKEEYITETALTEAISAVTGAVVYQAGDYIGITDDTISVTGITDLVAGDNITITASGSSAIISSNGSGDVTIEELASVSGTLETEIQVVSSAIPDISSLASKSEVNTVSGTLQTEIVAISGAMVDVPTGVSGVVAGQGIAITASGSDYVISCTVTGATSDVTMADLVSVSGTLQAEIQTVSGSIPSIANLATKTEVANVEADVQIVSAAIPTLPTEEEVEFAEVDLSDYALASAIPDVSNFVTGPTVSAIVDTALVDVPSGVSGLVGGTNVSITASGSNYVIDATVPDVSNLATKTDVATVSAAIPTLADLNTQGITDIQVVQALPVSPVSTVLYLIPEA